MLSGIMIFPSLVVTPPVLDGLALAVVVPAACVEPAAVVDAAVAEEVELSEGAGDLPRLVADPIPGWEEAGVTY